MKPKKKIKVVVCDDHNIVREGIVALLNQSGDIEVVGEASNGVEVLELIHKKSPDVVLIDLSMPVLNGLETTAKLRSNYPQVKVIVLTQHENEEYIIQMLKAGVSGYVLKTSIADELIKGIKDVANGEKFFSASISRMMLDDFIKRAQGLKSDKPKSELTNREYEVLKLIAEGYTNQEVADKLFISIRTVEFHRANIMHKLNLKDFAALVKYAIQKGIIDIENIEEKI
ncbi:MAG: DNA-binding response regulator, LuxR family [Ignavibacteriae bacterium]|nr:MAG: DNA-binding response regulator, LuxR family [Ignavibacteriota bacterium]